MKTVILRKGPHDGQHQAMDNDTATRVSKPTGDGKRAVYVSPNGRISEQRDFFFSHLEDEEKAE